MSDIKIPCMHGWTSGCRICDLMDEVINLEQQLSDCKAENEGLKRDAEYGEILIAHIDRLSDPVPEVDSLETIVNELIDKFEQALNNQQDKS